MGRILAIDYGTRRSGLAWTDPLRMIATGIGSFDTAILIAEIEKSVKGGVESIVLGMPGLLRKTETDSTGPILAFKKILEKKFPAVPVSLWDESHTSSRAMKEMIKGGVPRKKRADKHLVNEISATLILQEYLDSNP